MRASFSAVVLVEGLLLLNEGLGLIFPLSSGVGFASAWVGWLQPGPVVLVRPLLVVVVLVEPVVLVGVLEEPVLVLPSPVVVLVPSP